MPKRGEWGCAECERFNSPESQECRYCLTPRPDQPRVKAGGRREDHRCRWESGSRRCWMRGTITLDLILDPKDVWRTRWYCRWHYDLRMSAPGTTRRADVDEFTRWVQHERDYGDCSDWVHAPVTWLWAVVSGEDVPNEPPSRRACGRGWPHCPYSEEGDLENLPGCRRQGLLMRLERLAKQPHLGRRQNPDRWNRPLTAEEYAFLGITPDERR